MPKITASLLPFWQISVFCQNFVIILSSKQDLSHKSLNHLVFLYVYSADNHIHFSLALLHWISCNYFEVILVLKIVCQQRWIQTSGKILISSKQCLNINWSNPLAALAYKWVVLICFLLSLWQRKGPQLSLSAKKYISALTLAGPVTS